MANVLKCLESLGAADFRSWKHQREALQFWILSQVGDLWIWCFERRWPSQVPSKWAGGSGTAENVAAINTVLWITRWWSQATLALSPMTRGAAQSARERLSCIYLLEIIPRLSSHLSVKCPTWKLTGDSLRRCTCILVCGINVTFMVHGTHEREVSESLQPKRPQTIPPSP